MTTEVPAEANKPWKGACLDDGTGRNVYFVDEAGKVYPFVIDYQ